MGGTSAAHLSGSQLAPGSQPGGAGRYASGAARKPNGQEQPATILVVEDEVLIRLAVCEFLRESGYRVFEASNAAEAQKVLASTPGIDLVFSDVRMPGTVDGLGLAAWVRRELPAVEVILTSGEPQVVKIAKGHSPGVFIEKPYSYEALIAQIKTLIGR